MQKKNIDFHSEIEELIAIKNSRNVISSDVTNSVARFPGGLITRGRETQYRTYKFLVIAGNIANIM